MEIMVDWPHAPPHRFTQGGLYFVTARTYGEQQLYSAADRLDGLRGRLFELAAKHRVELQAWALLSNHYHLVGRTDVGEALRAMLSELHSLEAIECNRRDATPGRKVWFQFRDTALTHQGSWLARLRYTNENPAHHGLVSDAKAYPWCSARWFEETARKAFVETVQRCGTARLNVADEFEVVFPSR